MRQSAAFRRWYGPPLIVQVLVLLVGGLVVAQLVTLLLTIVLPPAPPAQHDLRAIAASLGGEAGRRRDPLERTVQSGPPDLSGSGWIVSERSRDALAGLLDLAPGDVRLAFYSPLPFAGTGIVQPRLASLPDDGAAPAFATAAVETGGVTRPASLLIYTQARGGPPSAGGFPGGAPAQGAFPGGFPGGARPGVGPGGATGTAGAPSSSDGRFIRQAPDPDDGPGTSAAGGPSRATAGQASAPPPPSSAARPAPHGVGPGVPPGPATVPAVAPATPVPQVPGSGFAEDLGRFWDRTTSTARRPNVDAAPPADGTARGDGPERRSAADGARDVAQDGAVAAARPPAVTPIQPDELHPGSAERPSAGDVPVPLAAPSRGLFGIAPRPFVEGRFIAAARLPDGSWAVVQPAAEGFPNSWQRRVLIWFALAFAVVAPLGWIFARRLVRPIRGFARAAEQLGRDPSSAMVAGLAGGPAELGRAARAFGVMQSRLKSFVDDRTAMVGAISHDLRTPLTRLRFRLEEIDDDGTREGMIGEVEEMEAMISSVLDFIRDASTPGARERLDLATLVEDVVADATMIGGEIALDAAQSASVEVDPLGMRRVLSNLVENALKYGERARVSLHVEADEVVTEIVDEGPGLPEDELERAFEPFFRSAGAAASGKTGYGLGLAVCRSIARAHGGDVRLRRSDQGFRAELRVPLAYRQASRLAA